VLVSKMQNPVCVQISVVRSRDADPHPFLNLLPMSRASPCSLLFPSATSQARQHGVARHRSIYVCLWLCRGRVADLQVDAAAGRADVPAAGRAESRHGAPQGLPGLQICAPSHRGGSPGSFIYIFFSVPDP
jgi:hypothetical protein